MKLAGDSGGRRLLQQPACRQSVLFLSRKRMVLQAVGSHHRITKVEVTTAGAAFGPVTLAIALPTQSGLSPGLVKSYCEGPRIMSGKLPCTPFQHQAGRSCQELDHAQQLAVAWLQANQFAYVYSSVLALVLTATGRSSGISQGPRLSSCLGQGAVAVALQAKLCASGVPNRSCF